MKRNLKKTVVMGALLLGMPLLTACEKTAGVSVEKVSRDSYMTGEMTETTPQTEMSGGDMKQEYKKQESRQHVHQFEEIVVKEADCREMGVKEYKCACGESYAESIARKKHTDGGWQVLAESTEETEGLEARMCRECGAVLEMHTIPVIQQDISIDGDGDHAGLVEKTESEKDNNINNTDDRKPVTPEAPINTHTHVYEEEMARVEPDCVKDGAVFTRCSCGDIQAETIPALGHTWEIREQMEADCVTDGFVVKQCHCNETERQTLPAKGHTPGTWSVVKESTYTELGVKEQRCTDCNTLIAAENMDVLPHEHQYTELISQEAGCTTKGVKTLTCKICGNIKTEEIPARGHTEQWEVVREADCAAEGMKELKCMECGNVSETERIPARGHEESEWIVDKAAACTETGSRHKSCVTCGTETIRESIPAAGHSFGGFTVTQEPSCDEAGIKTRTCSACGESASVSIDPKGHSFGEWIVDEEASEEQEGSRHKECADCGEIIREEIEQLPRHEHEFSESGREESTCSAAGTITYRCGICGESYTESIPKKEHTPGDWEIKKAATEEEAGLRVRSCTVCKEETASEVIEKLPHIHVYAETRVEPDCVNDGYTEFTCGCGDTYREVIKAAGHSYVVSERKEADCREDGYVKTVCENCQDMITETIEKISHNYVEIDRVEPSCGSKGRVVTQCTMCKDEQVSELEALEHSYEVTETVEPTCTADGCLKSVCSLCGDVKMEENGTATGHDFGEWVTVKEPALGEDGEKTSTCAACGQVMAEKIDMLMTDGVDSVYFVELSDGTQRMLIGHFDREAAQEIYDMVNEHRRQLGVPELTAEDFQSETDRRALEIAILYEHVRPTDRPMNFGENILQSPYKTDASAMYDAWFNSQGHKANMEKADYKYSAVSVFYEYTGSKGTKKFYSTQAVQTFGRRTMEYYMSF